MSHSPSFEARLSRSGVVHVIQHQGSYDLSTKANNQIVKTKPAARIALSIVFAGSVLCSIAALVISQHEKRGDIESKAASSESMKTLPVPSCPAVLSNPALQLEEWLEGKAVSSIKIEEQGTHILGGFQHRIIKLSCDDLTLSLGVILSKQNQEWHLKNYSRLEN